jgi:acetyl esterase
VGTAGLYYAAAVLHPVVWGLCRVAAWGQRHPDKRSLDERRAAEYRRARPPAEDGIVDGLQVNDHRVEVDGGQLTVRTYRPPGGERLPAHLLAHGGAFWSGSLDQVDGLARHYVRSAGCVVASVDYRLAPEHPWPAAPEDCYAALRWLVRDAEALGVDATRVSVGGVSVGGCLAAVVALMARDRGGPPLVFQLLEVPVTDLTMSQPSITRFARGYLLTRDAIIEGYDYYLPDVARRTEPYASPLLAQDLSDLPPAFVLTSEYDPLRDEGEEYARRLRAAGVAVTAVRANGHAHSTTHSSRLIRSARRYQELTAAALRAAYDPA